MIRHRARAIDRATLAIRAIRGDGAPPRRPNAHQKNGVRDNALSIDDAEPQCFPESTNIAGVRHIEEGGAAMHG